MMGETRIGYRIQWRNLFEDDHLQDQEEDGRVTLRWTLRKLVLKMGGRWNWLRIVSSGGLSY
jgi:hypothetical protein